MNKLSNDAVVYISSYLSLVDKLNLACACKQPHKIISENSLLQQIDL